MHDYRSPPQSSHSIRSQAAPAPVGKSSKRGSTNVAVLRERLGNAGLARVLCSLHQDSKPAIPDGAPSIAREETANASPLQRKAIVSVPDNPEEREADQVMRMAEPEAIGPAPFSIHRKCAEKEVNRAPAGKAGTELDVDAAVRAAQGGGSPLPMDVRSFFEPRFGADFSRVRVHADGEAAAVARAVQARAYTIGSDLVFGAGQHAPGTDEGKRLLAHELAHVVQQRAEPSGSVAQLQRQPAEGGSPSCGRHFTRRFRGKIKERPGPNPDVPFKFYATDAEHKNVPGRPVEDLVPGTELEAGDTGGYAQLWRSVCFKTSKMPAQILWVLNKYISNLDAQPTASPTARPDNAPPSPSPSPSAPAQDPEPDAAGAPASTAATAPHPGCNAAQTSDIEAARAQAITDLATAITALSTRPLSSAAADALWLVSRMRDEDTADKVVTVLNTLRSGLATADIECDTSCKENVVAHGLLVGIGSISVCVPEWTNEDPDHRAKALIHEAAHRFDWALGAGLDPYFNSDDCSESSTTISLPPAGRLKSADSPACVTYLIAHGSPASLTSRVADYSGASVKTIIQSHPKGDIDLSGPTNKPFFFINKIPTPNEFSFRWRLVDEGGQEYPLQEKDGEELDFGPTNAETTMIGEGTRALLRSRGVQRGEVQCFVTAPWGQSTSLAVSVAFK